MKRKKRNIHAQTDNLIAATIRKHGRTRGAQIATQYIKDGLLGDVSTATARLEKAIQPH